MYAIDDSILDSPGIDPYVVKVARTLGLRGLRSPEGKALFGSRLEDATWMVVTPTGDINEACRVPNWVGGRVDQEGRGFTNVANTFHQATVDAIRTPSPIYERGLETGVVDAVIADEAEARQMLADALAMEPEAGMAFN